MNPPSSDLRIAGMVPLSTVDWPGHLVATVFCQGCPWRCVYCQNSEILDPRTPGAVPWSQVAGLLERRHGLLDGVVFSGGEATMQHAVVTAAQEVRARGFAVGLHTGGAFPTRMATLLGADGADVAGARGRPLVDWVGFDVKAPPERYRETVGRTGARDRVHESLRLLIASGVEHELRMTVTPTLAPTIGRVLELIASEGGSSVVLQQAQGTGTPGDFASELEQLRDWDACFVDAVEQAREVGVRAGVEVTSRVTAAA